MLNLVSWTRDPPRTESRPLTGKELFSGLVTKYTNTKLRLMFKRVDRQLQNILCLIKSQ